MIQYKSIDQSQFAPGEDIEQQERLFDEFSRENLGSASIFLKTCNRSEIYYDDGKEDGVPDDVARHLFRVVSGLESAIVGERAVQGQVKEAYYTAKAQRPLSAELHKLFQSALQVGKRVRNETEISHGAVSHSLAAIEILEQELLEQEMLGGQVCYLPTGKNAPQPTKRKAHLPAGQVTNLPSQHLSLKDAHITIIGVNKLTADILKFLQNKGAKMVFLANRSQIKAHHLADPLGIKVYTLDEKKDFLQHTDILISATSAPHLIIHKDDIPEQKQMLAIDLAFPRDIDSRLKELPHVHLYNIRDVEEKVRQNLDVREAEVKKAEVIIEEEIQEMQEALERRKRYMKEKCI